MAVEHGYMIVADITGYTKFLSESELDHAHEIIQSLINAMLKHIHSPITLARVEGDAIFAYTLSDCFLQGQTLLESLEHIYFTFSHELESNDRNTTCTCNACANMETLDLKIIVNYGEFMLQTLGQQTDLIGTDVNSTHRLLKNTITESTGVKAYAFFTDAAITEMKLGEMTSIMKPHSESYEHIGEVNGFVFDLRPAWIRERERRRIFITQDQAEIVVDFDVPVPPMVAWDYINEPATRARYRFSDEAIVERGDTGRIETGAVYHCVHGDSVNLETVLDWKPFEYVTVDSLGTIAGVITTTRMTIQLSPNQQGTQISIFMLQPKAKDPDEQSLVNEIWKSEVKQNYSDAMNRIPDAIEEMISEDTKSGRLNMRLIATHR